LILTLIGRWERLGDYSAMERALRRLEKAFPEEAGVLAREEGFSGIVLLSVILKLTRNGLTTIRNVMRNGLTMIRNV
jgi:hypothetical protein